MQSAFDVALRSLGEREQRQVWHRGYDPTRSTARRWPGWWRRSPGSDPEQAAAAAGAVRSRLSPPAGWVAHGRRIGCGSGWASARRSGGRRLDVEVAERVVFALVAQRALEPASKPAATRWVVERVVIDLQPRAATWDDYAK
jgi:hypothetical protein